MASSANLWIGIPAAMGLAVLGVLAGHGCDLDVAAASEPAPVVIDTCEHACPVRGIRDGNAAISGITEVDAFFSAALEIHARSLEIDDRIRVSLEAMARSLGLEPTEEESLSVLTDKVVAHAHKKIDAHVQGGLHVVYPPPKCELASEVAQRVAAECDPAVEPEARTPRCRGICTARSPKMCDDADATLVCEGVAPRLHCPGECVGTCSIDVTGACAGTCVGICEGACEASDGEGRCAGACAGTCIGACEVPLHAGGACEGRCQGQCTFTPVDGEGCEPSLVTMCKPRGTVAIPCDGRCEGELLPPAVSASCATSVRAKVGARTECELPTTDVRVAFRSSIDAYARAEFLAWLETFRIQYARLVAAEARADLLMREALGDDGMLAAADGELRASLEIERSPDARRRFGAGCALQELADAQLLLEEAHGRLQASTAVVTSLRRTFDAV